MNVWDETWDLELGTYVASSVPESHAWISGPVIDVAMSASASDPMLGMVWMLSDILIGFDRC